MKVLFVYPAMMLGGSTTSLLSVLYNLDTEKYKVDLALDRNTGAWLNDIPDSVNLIEPLYLYPNNRDRIMHQLLSPRFMRAKIVAKILERSSKSHKLGQQYLEMKDVDFYRDIEEEYDVAIAFLEGQQCKYVANHVKAKRKIAWIHIDYKASGFRPEYDIDSMRKFDSIVTVSEQCLKSYQEAFPELADRCVYIENILSKERLCMLAQKESNGLNLRSEDIKLVSTCRISFSAKGLDRAVRAISCAHKEGIVNFERLQWYIVGAGNDFEALKNLIEAEGLERQIHLLGMKTNPYPYLKGMDLFFLPSIWEGKPMAVTEAQILGLPALVTHYSSADEQIRDGVDGMVVDNSEEGVYQGIKFILEHPEKIAEWKANVVAHDYSNIEEIKKVEDLING